MGPPGFNECYLCHREFGSRSLEIHEPQCLAKWRRNNKSLPKSERQRTPSPPSDRHQGANVRRETDPSGSSEDPSPDGSSPKRARNSPKFMERRKLTRPSTATLNKPKVLNPRMKDEIDMSEMSRQMMESLVLQRDNTKGSSDYSSDFSSSSSSSSSVSNKSRDEEEQGEASSTDSESEGNGRPSTMRLRRPTSHISIPVITPSNTRPLPRRGKTATIRSKMSLRNRLIAEEIIGPKDKIPEPCLTCGKEQNPERFHSHPRHLPKFKAKNKFSRERNKQEQPSRSIVKVAVTKPTALKYKSRSLESSPEAPHTSNSKCVEKSGTKTNSKGKSKSRSAENSPKSKVKLGGDAKHKSENKSKMKHRFARVSEAFAGPRDSPFGNSEKDLQSPSTKRPKDKNDEGSLGSEYGLENLRTVKSSMSPVERAGTAPLKLCYICCREFGSRSLSIHEPQCLEKWRRENNRLPDHLKREEPKRPSKDLSKEEWNEYAWNMAQSQLIPCENCGRTFKPDRLEVHQRGCKPPPGFKKSQERKDLASPKPFYRPTVVCFICGREFGSRSIAIHEPQCLAKWKNENDKLPQHLQRPEPVKPEAVLDGDGRVDQQAMAEAAWRSHLDTLVKCEGCERTFFPDRLAVHQKSCKSLNT